MTGTLLRLYQLGWDEHLWSQGEKADISMYANQAFQRPSACQASQWKDHQMDISIFDQETSDVKHARYACYAALGLVSVYIVKKVSRNNKLFNYINKILRFILGLSLQTFLSSF